MNTSFWKFFFLKYFWTCSRKVKWRRKETKFGWAQIPSTILDFSWVSWGSECIPNLWISLRLGSMCLSVFQQPILLVSQFSRRTEEATSWALILRDYWGAGKALYRTSYLLIQCVSWPSPTDCGRGRKYIKAKYYFSKIMQVAGNSSNNVNIKGRKKVTQLLNRIPALALKIFNAKVSNKSKQTPQEQSVQ